MSSHCAETVYICHRCPPPAQPIIKEISIKQRHAQLIRIKGTFNPGNKHTANLPGTKRVVHPKNPSGTYIWPCRCSCNSLKTGAPKACLK